METIPVEKIGARWVARVPFEKKDIVKAAGFRWDRDSRQWYTTDSAIAASVAEPGAEDRIKAQVAERERVAAANIESSRAQDADIDLPVPSGLSYLPYQRAGIASALKRPNVLFGDEMGLGKTIQAIGVINADPTLHKILIVCPASLKLNWYRELRKWLTRDLSIAIVASNFPVANITIINYDVLDKFKKALHGQEWDAVICDEAHYLKNADAKRTQVVVGIQQTKRKEGKPSIRARRKIFLTGTPIPNRPLEGWTIFSYLGAMTHFWGYVTRYCDARKNGYGWDFSGASNLSELQDKLRASVMIRRKKADVLTDLPAKQRVIVQLDPTGCEHVIRDEEDAWEEREERMIDLRARVELAKASENQSEYEKAVQELRDAAQLAFEEISQLRHDTALAKVPQVIEHIEGALEEEGHKLVVFAHHRDVIKAITDHLWSKNIKNVEITGSTPMVERQRNVDAFQKDPEVRVFVGNMQAAGVGLTLTAASHVIFAELDWVPGNVSQCEDRCHRIGQRDSVLVQHLVLDGSIDARMAQTLISKQEVLDAALDNEKPELAQDVADPARERAATQDTSRKQVEALAAAMTPERIAAIHEGLRIVSGMDQDRASAQNGIGFSKMDTQIGNSLAGCGSLTAKQAALGFRLVTKYRRQIPEHVLTSCQPSA